MHLNFTIGRMTVFHFTLFEIADESIGFPMEDPDVVVVHHHYEDDEKEDGPEDMFGGKGN